MQYLAYPQKITRPIIQPQLREHAIRDSCERAPGWLQ
ncbi:hypothetical protein, partial [Salmonella enterica]